jgi:REP element-mobilizing transposase RayT
MLYCMSNRAAHSKNLRKGRFSETGRIYFISTSCFARRRLFEDATNAEILMREFARQSCQTTCDSLAYVVMPDHIHWLVQLTSDVALHTIVQSLKGRSARQINLIRSSPTRVWQPSFHDHALRAEEDIETAGKYLIHNPVRAGLVHDVDGYPYWDTVWHRRRRG